MTLRVGPELNSTFFGASRPKKKYANRDSLAGLANDLFFGASRDVEGLDKRLVGETSQATLGENLDQASEIAETGTEMSADILGRRQRALGLQVAGREKSVQDRKLSLGGVLDEVFARNKARTGFRDRSRAAGLAGVDMRNFLQALGLDATGFGADLENKRNDINRKLAAQESAGRLGALGTVAGAALGFAVGGPAGAYAGANLGGGGG